MTGRGPAPVKPNDSVMAFIDATTSNIDVEVPCSYDSTALFEKDSKQYNIHIYNLLLFYEVLYYSMKFLTCFFSLPR